MACQRIIRRTFCTLTCHLLLLWSQQSHDRIAGYVLSCEPHRHIVSESASRMRRACYVRPDQAQAFVIKAYSHHSLTHSLLLTSTIIQNYIDLRVHDTNYYYREVNLSRSCEPGSFLPTSRTHATAAPNVLGDHGQELLRIRVERRGSIVKSKVRRHMMQCLPSHLLACKQRSRDNRRPPIRVPGKLQRRESRHPFGVNHMFWGKLEMIPT